MKSRPLTDCHKADIIPPIPIVPAGEIHENRPGYQIEERCRQWRRVRRTGVYELEAALAENPLAWLISTPPALHDEYVRQAMERGAHVFAEVPFDYDRQRKAQVIEKSSSYPAVLAVTHTSRYLPAPVQSELSQTAIWAVR